MKIWITDWIGHILRRNCHLKHIIEERIEYKLEGIGRRRSKPKQLLDDFKEKRGCWKMMREALDHILWRTRFGRNYRHVVRQATE
jgi:hypothetical protein